MAPLASLMNQNCLLGLASFAMWHRRGGSDSVAAAWVDPELFLLDRGFTVRFLPYVCLAEPIDATKFQSCEADDAQRLSSAVLVSPRERFSLATPD
jgi:hypothetical protein